MPTTFALPTLLHIPRPGEGNGAPESDAGEGNGNAAFAHVWLFGNVAHQKTIRQAIIKGKTTDGQTVPESAIVDARMIVDVSQLLLAATRALLNQRHGKLKTRTVYSEIIFNLSPGTNISESLRTFGVRDDSTALLALVLSSSQSPPDDLTPRFAALFSSSSSSSSTTPSPSPSPTTTTAPFTSELALTPPTLAHHTDLDLVRSTFRLVHPPSQARTKRDSDGKEVVVRTRDDAEERQWVLGEVVNAMALKGHT
ncbi:CGI-121-domain-containing protein [Gonapodya prolifera JEL478]|uniref:EKC/KEOPS complex subunit CGI121 n=1 Tax=Gonapodya prolifera (strain JEL478) TaxID=1344416 RepID=A0A139A5M6_GONPJ|nr:CGI-121-domain-containing protein [Gonapodya prolifera JEL478]|eukprot:KXS12041.1 CGI-121-domain-containing protein [Gonapodya prolifera JEL478]